MSANGIIHVIDKVLMPPADEVEDSGDGVSSSSDDDSGLYLTIFLVVLLLIGGGAGAVLFMRNRGTEENVSNDLIQGGIMNQLQKVDPDQYAPQPVQHVAQVQAVQPIQMVEAIPQPAVAEPIVLRQWTDENGYTWRSMNDGSTLWWTGTEWQKYA